MSHPSTHLLIAAAILAGSIGVTAVVRNRAIRRRMLFSALGAVAAALVHFAALRWPDLHLLRRAVEIEQLLFVLALANAGIALLFNPWFKDAESNRAPAIIQDFLIAAIVVWGAVVVFDVPSFEFFATSTIVAAIAGFAAQGTLGNAFAGIALQMERPFRVGHWIAVGEWVGRVTEVTWRATKIRTKAGNMVTVPNSEMAGQGIINYSEPTAPTQVQVEVGASYSAPPNEVRDALLAAARSATYVIPSPVPDVLLLEFAGSSINYRVRFWIDDFSKDDEAKDAVRTRIYYEFKRRNIEIPYPIQVEIPREAVPADTQEQRRQFARTIAGVSVLAPLPADAHQALASTARELMFADGEVIVRQGEAGASMFVVQRGRVAITVGDAQREVAVTDAGGYFGEMSLLTGDPRSATVIARGDCTVLEITGEAFRSYVQGRPEAIDQIAAAAGTRRKELEDARALAGAAPAVAGVSLKDRMRVFFGLA